MEKMKSEQRERKEQEAGGKVVYTQISDSSSDSSSDDEALDEIERTGELKPRGVWKASARDQKRAQAAKMEHWKFKRGSGSGSGSGDGSGAGAGGGQVDGNGGVESAHRGHKAPSSAPVAGDAFLVEAGFDDGFEFDVAVVEFGGDWACELYLVRLEARRRYKLV